MQQRATTRAAAPVQAADKAAPGHRPAEQGNQARLREVAGGARLRIGAADDPLEREADVVAERVLRMPASPRLTGDSGVLRRACSACAAEDKLHRKADGPASGMAPPSVSQVLAAPGAKLAPPLRSFFEPRLGRDLSDVRVHDGAEAARSAAAVDARAYTVGSSVVFGAGAYAPGTPDGMRLLAHELAHVAQQDRGTARRNTLRRTTHGPSTPTNCSGLGLSARAAGVMAHTQIAGTLVIPPHFIPRATKRIRTPLPPPGTPPGFADLWSRAAAGVQIAEIKSTLTGSTVAAAEAAHYVTRHTEWQGRVAGGTGDASDANYRSDVGGALPGGLLDLTSRTGPDLPIGPFAGDASKVLHIEGDNLGAMVYWCTGGMPKLPPPVPVPDPLKKFLEDLLKKLQAARKALRDAAEAIAKTIGAIAKLLGPVLKALFILLVVLAIIALIFVAIVCLIGAAETFGLTLVCSAAAVGAAAFAGVALLALVGLPAPGLSTALTSAFTAAHPPAPPPESGADYDSEDDLVDTASGGTAVAQASAPAPTAPDLMAALQPIADKLTDPVAFAKSVADSIGSLGNDSVVQLNNAVAALDGIGDSDSSGFIRSIIQSSGLDKPDALASAGPAGEADKAIAQAEPAAPGADAAAAAAAPASQPAAPEQAAA